MPSAFLVEDLAQSNMFVWICTNHERVCLDIHRFCSFDNWLCDPISGNWQLTLCVLPYSSKFLWSEILLIHAAAVWHWKWIFMIKFSWILPNLWTVNAKHTDLFIYMQYISWRNTKIPLLVSSKTGMAEFCPLLILQCYPLKMAYFYCTCVVPCLVNKLYTIDGKYLAGENFGKPYR